MCETTNHLVIVVRVGPSKCQRCLFGQHPATRLRL